MLYFNNIKSFSLILILTLFSINTWAESYHYRADVKGMVCAFCVYNVGKNIRKLPGVDADSVNVSLKENFVKFSSQQKVAEKQLADLFSQSGFTISNLIVSKVPTHKLKSSKKVRLDVSIDVFETDQFTSLLQTIGDIAIKKPSRLRIEAPQEQEETILKALLMGRQKVVQVFFIPNDSADKMHLQLFDAAEY